MADVKTTGQQVHDTDVAIHWPTLVHLLRCVERGHTNFVFAHRELSQTFPDIRSADVGRLASVLGPGWGVHATMRHVLTFTGEKRDGVRQLRGLLEGRE